MRRATPGQAHNRRPETPTSRRGLRVRRVARQFEPFRHECNVMAAVDAWSLSPVR
jgi:hypothetical protein